MTLDPEQLVRAYLGYRDPANDLFTYQGLTEIDSQMGILPGDREEDPYPASETPHGDQHGSSKMPGPEKQPSSEARWPVSPGEPREKQRVLPLSNSHPKQRDVNIDRFVLNVPDARPDSRYRSETDVPVRTPGKPGEEVGNPTKFDYGMPTRRHLEGRFPKERQREQRGKAKRVSHKWYKRNRSKHRRRMQRRQRRLRTRSQFKRQRKLRQKYPRRFRRRPGGGFRTPGQRSKEWREEQKQKQQRRADYAYWPDRRESGLPFLFGADLQYAEIDGFDGRKVHFTVFPEFTGDDFGVMGAPERKQMDPLDFLGQAVFDDDDDLEDVLEAIEEAFGPEVWDRDPDEVESPWLDEDAVIAASSLWHTHFYEERAPSLREKSDDQWKDERQEAEYAEERELERDRTSGVPRGTRTTPTYPNAPDHWPSDMTQAPYWKGRPDDKTPATSLNDLTPVEDSGGASKVIPWDYPGENKQDRTFTHGPGQPPPGGLAASTKVADTISQILRRTAPKVKQRATDRPARVTGHDRTKGVWFFQSGKYIQKMRAVPRTGSKASNVTQMDVYVSCSCPFWRWQGPEHWAKKNRYLYDRNRTKGTASFPEIRDPNFRHGVCKHLVAVFNLVRSQKLKFSPKRASHEHLKPFRYLLDSSAGVEVEPHLTAEDLVVRYLGNT